MAKEYIEREAAIQYFKKRSKSFIGHEPVPPALVIMGCANEVDAIPAADVAPVVFCKDCQYIAHFTDGHLECRLLADLRPIPCTYVTMKETDFCSYGKRRWELDADMREVQDG